MFAIVEYSTDMTRPDYKIEFTNSKPKVRRALGIEGRTTYVDPVAAKNWHHTYVTVYKMPEGWRKPTKSFIDKEVARQRGSMYSPNAAGVMYNAIYRDGYKIEHEEDI